MRRSSSFLLFAALLLGGCGSMPSREQPPAVAAQAERLYDDGEFAAAAQAFLDAAAARRAQRDFFRLRAAEAWREEGDLARAGQTLEGINARRLSGEQRLRLDLLQAELALDRGDALGALGHLSMAPSSVPAEFAGRFHFLRARALERDGDAFGAAAERAQLDATLAAADRAENTRVIQQLLAQVDDDALYRRSAALPAGHPLYLHAGRLLSARGLALPRPYERQAVAGVTGARPPAGPDGYRPFNRVALLLPAHGPLALAARSVRDGFMAAYFAEPRQRPQVQVYDTGEGIEGTREAYARAVADGAEIVVGPLAREDVAALFEQTALPAPLIALNRGGSLATPPGSVSFALAPEDEGIAAAERMLRRGWQRVLVAAGEDESAQRSVAAFQERMQQRGAQVVAQIRLPENSPDYGASIRQALNAAGSRSAAGVDPAATSTAVDADAIFLAARSAQARLFAPQLRVAGVYDIPIIATSQISGGVPNARMDRELDGIEFTELPWLLSDLPGLPERRPLGEALESARGGGTRLFAFGVDAFRLLGHLDQLAADPNRRLEGATGQLWLDGFGTVQRAPGWARYSNGHVQPAPDGALISDGAGAP